MFPYNNVMDNDGPKEAAMDTMDAKVMSPLARVVAAAGGLLLVAATFLPWGDAGGTTTSGWDLASGVCVLLVLTGAMAVIAAATGGRIGFFRPDLSLNGAADLLGVVSTVVVAWQILDLPAGASAAWGIFAALAGAVAVMGVFGDYRSVRGAPAFPPLGSARERRAG
jgi:hypothetical protein